jgi:hypothetical protein
MWAMPAQAGPVDEIKADFDRAMKQTLAERVPSLNVLDQAIEQRLFEGDAPTGEARVNLNWYRFRVKQELAKHPEAKRAFGRYADVLRQTLPRRQGTAIVERVVNRFSPKANPGMCVQLFDAALEKLAEDDPVRPFLLLRKAQCLERLPGRRAEGIPVVEKLIGQHPDSEHRPAGMRLLAKLQVITGEDDTSLQTLQLMQQQYAGTWYEQWAHIFQASIWERRKGEPQKALRIYRGSLDQFQNHHFAGYVRSEIARLQDVIEGQLIDDALEGIGRNDQSNTPSSKEPAHAHRHNPIVTDKVAQR